MDLGPFGLSEILFIALLALVIFGPRRLPEMGHAAGRMVTRLRRAAFEFKRAYEDELDTERRSTADPVREMREDLRSVARDLRDAGQGVVDELKTSVATPPSPSSLTPRSAGSDSAQDAVRSSEAATARGAADGE